MIDMPVSHNYCLPRVKNLNILKDSHPWGYAIVSQSYKLDSTEVTICRNDGTEVGYFRHNDLLSEETARKIIDGYLAAIE